MSALSEPVPHVESKTFFLFFVRHGETTANRDDILQGQCDYPLTEKGLADAHRVGIALKSMRWKKTCASDLTRAYMTAEILLSESPSQETPLVSSTLLREMSFGVREALPRGTSVAKAKQIVAAAKNIDVSEVEDTSESREDLDHRQLESLKFIVRLLSETNPAIWQSKEDLNVLCVSHGGFIRHFLRTWCRIDHVEKITNCSVTRVKVEVSNDSFVCEADETLLNFSDHLVENPVEEGEGGESRGIDIDEILRSRRT